MAAQFGSLNASSGAFRKHYADLVRTIQDPEILTCDLYSEDIITSSTRNEIIHTMYMKEVKTDLLLQAVESQIAVNPNVFDIFLSVLIQRPPMADLCRKLKDTYDSYSSTRTEVESIETKQTSSSKPRRKRSAQQYAYLTHSTVNPKIPKLGITDSDLIVTYTSFLKSVYKGKKFPIYGKWPPSPSKKFINIALVKKERVSKADADEYTRATIHGDIDDIVHKKEQIFMEDIACPQEGMWPKCILVEGAPGVGKSTFAWKLCRKWGKGKLLQQYRLVVLLRLRDKKVRDARSVSDLFRHNNPQVQQAVAEDIGMSAGKGVMLVFEGYDELPIHLRTEDSIFLDIIYGDELPEATVLITSRSSASHFLYENCRNYISQHIEILGFTKENIQSYLESTIGKDSAVLIGLQKYLSYYPHIRSMMYIPLNSAIVVEVYRNTKREQNVIPKTMTELYSSLVRSLLLRYLFDHPLYCKTKWRLRSFKDLPHKVYQQLCELSEIAYNGILQGQQVIFTDTDHSENFETLGLMQCVPELYIDEGPTVSYNFLHLTLQEYLAAFKLSLQPWEKQVEIFQRYKDHSHFQMVLRFLSGLHKFTSYPRDTLKSLFSKEVSTGDQSLPTETKIFLNTLHWIFEAQDTNTATTALPSHVVTFKVTATMTPFDCFVLGHCIALSPCNWRIVLGRIGNEEMEMLVKGTLEKVSECSGGIYKMELVNSDVSPEGWKHLLKIPKHLIGKIEVVDLTLNKVDSDSCVVLSQLIPFMPHLKLLVLWHNPTAREGTAQLITSLGVLNSLETLNLNDTGIGIEECKVLSKLPSSLKELNIGDNHFNPETVEVIVNDLHHNKTLRSLQMIASHFSLQNSISMASMLRTNHTLVRLNISNCNIESEGAYQLANALCKNSSLQKLWMCLNPIGVLGAAAHAEMLAENKSLELLDVRDDSIGAEGTQTLIDSLEHNKKLKVLRLPERYKASVTNTRTYGAMQDRIRWSTV